MKIDNRKDYLLLLLYSAGAQGHINEPVVGRTRLVKMLFLFRKEVLDRFQRGDLSDIPFYEFYPWFFGPFSKQVYDDLKFFHLRGFVDERDKDEETSPESVAEWEHLVELEDNNDWTFTEYVEQEFYLTEKGCRFASKLYNQLSSSQKHILRDFKARTSTVPLRALLKYVYSQYPEATAKSKIRDDVLGG